MNMNYADILCRQIVKIVPTSRLYAFSDLNLKFQGQIYSLHLSIKDAMIYTLFFLLIWINLDHSIDE